VSEKEKEKRKRKKEKESTVMNLQLVVLVLSLLVVQSNAFSLSSSLLSLTSNKRSSLLSSSSPLLRTKREGAILLRQQASQQPWQEQQQAQHSVASPTRLSPPVPYAHPVTMSLALASLSAAGLYYGLTIKWARRAADRLKAGTKHQQHSDTSTTTTPVVAVQDTALAKTLHPLLMKALLAVYGVGLVSGAQSMRSAQQPLLQSGHAQTGVLSLSMLVLQAALSAQVPTGTDSVKKMHSGFGALTALAMVSHGLSGLKLFMNLKEKEQSAQKQQQ
jgi:hypothetical protein